MHDGRPGGAAAFLHQLRRDGRMENVPPSAWLTMAAASTPPSLSGARLLPRLEPSESVSFCPSSDFLLRLSCFSLCRRPLSPLFFQRLFPSAPPQTPPGSWFTERLAVERLPRPAAAKPALRLSATVLQPTLLLRGPTFCQQNALV